MLLGDLVGRGDRLLLNLFPRITELPVVVADEGADFYGTSADILPIHANEYVGRAVELHVGLRAPDDEDGELGGGRYQVWEVPLLITPDGVWIVLWLANYSARERIAYGEKVRQMLIGELVARGWQADEVPIGLTFVSLHRERNQVRVPLGWEGRFVFRSEVAELVPRICATPVHPDGDPDPATSFRLMADLFDIGYAVDLHTCGGISAEPIPQELMPMSGSR